MTKKIERPATADVVNTAEDLTTPAVQETVAGELNEGSRDERHDSIDPVTGQLTEEAQALRRERSAAKSE